MKIGKYDYYKTYSIMCDGEFFRAYDTEIECDKGIQEIQEDHENNERREKIIAMIQGNKLSHSTIKTIVDIISKYGQDDKKNKK